MGATDSQQGWDTPRILLRYRNALLLTAVVSLASCLAISWGVSRTATAATDQSVPATIAIYRARISLGQAHSQAVNSFTGGGRVLRSPGSDYQFEIARTGRYLSQVAERNAAGDAGSAEVQVIQALLSSYLGLIGRADAYFSKGDDALGVAALWDAHSLHEDILARLDRLGRSHARILDEQAGSGWGHPAMALLWLLPVLTSTVLLVAAQLFLRRRFRRRLTIALVLATGLTLAMGVSTALTLSSSEDLDTSRAEVTGLLSLRDQQLVAVRGRYTARLATLVQRTCGGSGCPETIEAIRSTNPENAGSAPIATGPIGIVVVHEDRAGAQATAAANGVPVEIILACGMFTVMLVLVGFVPRLNEYRFRS